MTDPQGGPSVASAARPDANELETSSAATAVGVVALLLPTCVTWIYFIALADASATFQQVAYGLGKAIQFGLPVVWVWAVRRRLSSRPAGPLASRPLDDRPAFARSLGLGLLLGLAVGGAMLGLYHGWLAPSGFFDGPGEAVRAKIAGLQLGAAWKFVAVGAFYSFGHSALEEYYWRWFVYRQLRRRLSALPANAISSVGFMAHHILVLAVYFGWNSPTTWLFSIGVAVGGALWAWLYESTRSLVGSWISHLLVDAAIFWIGYDLARELF